jgi:glycerol-3-phosphate acyltransferase PlsX
LARIALDAMGGDFAPDAAIAGALHAILELPTEHTLQLVGPVDVIRERVSALSTG